MKSKNTSKLKTTLDPDDELIDCVEAGKILSVAADSVRKGDAGTAQLTRIRIGCGRRQMVRLLKAEVLALRSTWIARAKARANPQERALRLMDKVDR